MAETLKNAKWYIVIQKDYKSHKKQTEAPVRRKEPMAKLENLKIVKLILVTTQPSRQTTKSN